VKNDGEDDVLIRNDGGQMVIIRWCSLC